jgi:hypothetical protein
MYRNMLPGSFILTPNYNFHARMGLNQYEAAMWQRVKNNQSFTELKQGQAMVEGKTGAVNLLVWGEQFLRKQQACSPYGY